MKTEIPTPRTDSFIAGMKGWKEIARARNLAYLCRIFERELIKKDLRSVKKSPKVAP